MLTKFSGFECERTVACEQALLFGRVKRVSRERASERRSREGQIGKLVRRLKGPYLSLEKEKENFCAVLTNSIEREREIRKFHVAVAQRRLRNVARKKRAARAKFLFC